MKKSLLLLSALATSVAAMAQNLPSEIKVDAAFEATTVIVPESPLKSQVLFVGGVDKVQTTATYGNAAGETEAKEWHDFIAFTPDETGASLGWVTVNHEMVEGNPMIGDGGGMTVFRIERDENTDTLRIVEQTLEDGRKGKFFNVDFANTTGETGMNCGGITSVVDGRVWTAEEWFRYSNSDIYTDGLGVLDTADFTIGTSTPAGFEGYNGQVIKKYQNFNYMTEIDPRQAKAIRKQYNWGRQNFEGGAVMPDNKTVFLSADATPCVFTKFVADVAGDFTKGKTYVYNQAGTTSKWIEIDMTDINNVLNFDEVSFTAGATMFNRLEWTVVDTESNLLYITETGRDNPGSRMNNGGVLGGVLAQHHVDRASAQGVPSAFDGGYKDLYGRVLQFNPATDAMTVFLEGGPEFDTEDVDLANYPEQHLSNPDGLGMYYNDGKSYLLIQEDLNGRTYGRMPAGIANSSCEMYILPLSNQNPTIEDLTRIAVVPVGAELTGGTGIDSKTILFNSQHPSEANPFPYNHSLTMAVTGWDQFLTSLEENQVKNTDVFTIFPNPANRTIRFNETTSVGIYNVNGARIRVARDVKSVDISDLIPGVYFVRNVEGATQKLIIE